MIQSSWRRDTRAVGGKAPVSHRPIGPILAGPILADPTGPLLVHQVDLVQPFSASFAFSLSFTFSLAAFAALPAAFVSVLPAAALPGAFASFAA